MCQISCGAIKNPPKVFLDIGLHQEDQKGVSSRLKVNNRHIRDPKGKAETLGSQFSDVFTQEDRSAIPEPEEDSIHLYQTQPSTKLCLNFCKISTQTKLKDQIISLHHIIMDSSILCRRDCCSSTKSVSRLNSIDQGHLQHRAEKRTFVTISRRVSNRSRDLSSSLTVQCSLQDVGTYSTCLHREAL